MKKIKLLLLGFLCFFCMNSVEALEYAIDKYDVNIKVNENNTFDITENITAYFNIPKHGIFRTIPLRNEVTRLDGTTTKNRVKITNLKVDKHFETSREDGNLKIQIGDASKVLTGIENYTIKYNYNIGKDPLKDIDEFYYNIIGDKWDTTISNITFTITMPKEFDESKLGFSKGTKGLTTNENITYEIDGKTIYGSYNGTLNPQEALTVRLELEEGYFVGAGFGFSIINYLLFLIPLIGLILSFLIWYKFGRDDQVIETVEFYPPENYNSLDIGFLYKGKAQTEDVVSLLIYLANKGYIKISETEKKTLFGKSKSFKITKLKDYDGNNINEMEFMRGLFLLGKNDYEVTNDDLYDKFYLTIDRILKNKNNKMNKSKIFEKLISSKVIIIILCVIISLITMVTIPTLEYSAVEDVLNTLLITSIYAVFFAIGIFIDMPLLARIIWLGFTAFHSIFMYMGMPIVEAIIDNNFYLIAITFGILCIIGMLIFLKYLPKRTPYGIEILGKIKGFKNFLETAEKEKLEEMVTKNPTYFYDILPYTYVLGVSNKWIKKFESISLQAPDWYDSSDAFSTAAFGSFINTTMNSAQSSMTSSPSNSSGGGFSGGGFSGGGSGGGGGGSW